MRKRVKYSQRPEIALSVINSKSIKYPRLYIPRCLIKDEQFQIALGRHVDMGWIALIWEEEPSEDTYKFVWSRSRERPYINLYMYHSYGDYKHENLQYRITTGALYVKLPIGQGFIERKVWWDRVPNVPKQPWDAWNEVLDV